MRSNTGGPSAVIVFKIFWPSWTSVICLEKLQNWSLGPMKLFQRQICASIRLRRLYPVAACQAIRPLLRIWAIWRSPTGGRSIMGAPVREVHQRTELRKESFVQHFSALRVFKELSVAKPCCSIDLIGDTFMRR